MEDIYQLIPDCVFNLSSQFTFDILLQLSTTSKYNSKSIYELTIHDHDNQPIYHTSINQIKKFHNIDTLMISKYYNFHPSMKTNNNLIELTHIKNINFHDEQQIQYVTKLTHLTSCNFGGMNSISIPYFHTNLSKLYNFRSDKIHNIKNIIGFTHLTYIDVLNNHDDIGVEQFLRFKNLKSLTIPVLSNLSNLSLLISLDTISIQNDYLYHHDVFVISHPTVTNIQIYDCTDFDIKNCYELMYLKLTDSGTRSLDINSSKLRTLIFGATNDDERDVNMDLDIDKCLNLEYFEHLITTKNLTYLSSRLTKLNSLSFGYGTNINGDDTVTHNLTSLALYYCPGVFDLNKYRNLKKLIMCNISHINIDKLIELEYLDCDCNKADIKRDCINSMNHQKLTYLRLLNNGVINLNRSNKLNKLLLHYVDEVDIVNIWNNDLKYLCELTYLHITMKHENLLCSEKIFDVSSLLNCVNLKHLECNFLLKNLSLLNKVNHLNICYHKSHLNIINKLTKLTALYISSNEKIDKIDVRGLKRLSNFYEYKSNLILPEITMTE